MKTSCNVESKRQIPIGGDMNFDTKFWPSDNYKGQGRRSRSKDTQEWSLAQLRNKLGLTSM
jgi:hypothetical protein